MDKKINFPGNGNQIISIENGKQIISGVIEDNFWYKPFLIFINKNGIIEKAFEHEKGANGYYPAKVGVIEKMDKNVLITGFSNNGIGTQMKITIDEFSGEGEMECNFELMEIPVNDWIVTEDNNWGNSINVVFTNKAINIPIKSITLKDSIICTSDPTLYISQQDEPTAPFCTIYPNPSNGQFKLSLTATEKAHVRVFSFTGTLVHEFYAQPGVNQFDLQAYPKGLYFVRVGDEVLKVVKE